MFTLITYTENYGNSEGEGVHDYGISEGKGGLKHGSHPLLGMDIFWNCPITKMAVSIKCPRLTFSAAMSCLDVKISLVPKHKLIVPSTLLAPATHIRTDKATKP